MRRMPRKKRKKRYFDTAIKLQQCYMRTPSAYVILTLIPILERERERETGREREREREPSTSLDSGEINLTPQQKIICTAHNLVWKWKTHCRNKIVTSLILFKFDHKNNVLAVAVGPKMFEQQISSRIRLRYVRFGAAEPVPHLREAGTSSLW